MQTFDEVHRAIHYPPDRRFRVWIDPRFVFAFVVVALAPFAVAWGQYLITGLPAESFLPPINLQNPPVPHGFPAWLRLTHFVNFFFLIYCRPRRIDLLNKFTLFCDQDLNRIPLCNFVILM